MRILPDTVYIPDIPDWAPDVRVELFNELIALQKGICPVCKKNLERYQLQDVYECIVTRGDAQGWPKTWHHLIFNLYNCVVVHQEGCHKHGHREFWWKYMCDLWGKEEMEKWYYNLPFRHNIRRFE